MTHLCVGKLSNIGSDNILWPGRRQAIIWTNAGILIIGAQGTNFSEILIEIQTCSLEKIHLKMLLPAAMCCNCAPPCGYTWIEGSIELTTYMLKKMGISICLYILLLAILMVYAAWSSGRSRWLDHGVGYRVLVLVMTAVANAMFHPDTHDQTFTWIIIFRRKCHRRDVCLYYKTPCINSMFHAHRYTIHWYARIGSYARILIVLHIFFLLHEMYIHDNEHHGTVHPHIAQMIGMSWLFLLIN